MQDFIRVLKLFLAPFMLTLMLMAISSCDQSPGNATQNSITAQDIASNCEDVARSERSACKRALFDSVDAIEIIESPLTGVALGWGWNRGDSEPIPTICIEFVPGEEPAQTRYMTMEEATDTYQLKQKLGITAEAPVKSIGYSAKGKAKFAKDKSISSSKSTFVLNAWFKMVFAMQPPHQTVTIPSYDSSKTSMNAVAPTDRSN